MLKTVFDSHEARVYTEDFRMYGMMHLPKGENHDTARLLNRNDKLFLRVTKGIVYSKGFRHPPTIDEYRASVGFMAIPIERLMWVYGGKAQDFEKVSYEAREVYLLYANYFIRGELRLAKNSVLTSFLDNVASNKPFQTLYNASIGVPIKGLQVQEVDPIEEFDFVTVNLRMVGGIFDISPPSASVSSSLAGQI